MDNLNIYGTDFYAAHFNASATASQAITTPVIGQYFDQDIVGSTGEVLGEFYASGQMWALLAGIILGYSFKSWSSYG